MGQTDRAVGPYAKRPWWPYLVAIAAIVLVIGFLVTRGGPSEPTAEDLQRDAKRVCTDDFVPKRLKAPSTAKFTGVSVSGDGTTYTVTGQVDSQNTFGAQVRASFTCTVRSSGDQWVLDSAQVSG